MAEANLINYSFKELATLMVKDRDIHEGVWGVYVRFGISAANAGPSGNDLKPTALVPIVELGLQKFDEVNNLSIDAAVENPATTKTTKAKEDVAAVAGLALGKAKRKP
jgi:hypothetical protein